MPETEPEPETMGEVGQTAAAVNISAASAFADPAYRVAIVDLLGGLAYSELIAFERLAEDAAKAPTLPDSAALAAMAAAEFGHFERLRDRLVHLDADPFAAMEPFHAPVDAFHEHTAPSNWLESLIKAYVGDGLASDFYREVAAYVDVDTRDLIVETMEDTGHSEFVVETVCRAIEDNPKLAGRLALWARRLMGEALSQAQRVAAERDALTALLVGGVDRPGMDLAAVARMFGRLTERHADRMEALGLQA
ncbi:MAG: ferritin-like fold-containing protein [Nocardioidaceae bacterium]